MWMSFINYIKFGFLSAAAALCGACLIAQQESGREMIREYKRVNWMPEERSFCECLSKSAFGWKVRLHTFINHDKSQRFEAKLDGD